MAVIGIDLGTTYCAAGVCVSGKPQSIMLEGEPTLPSVVGLQRSGKIAVGKVAKRNQAKSPQNTIVEVKRKMGAMDEVRKEPVKVALGEKWFLPQEISAMILKRIKECAEEELGEPVTGVVITCPAYFKDPQRAATKEAGQIAGLNVLKIINEPTAAAYAYGVNLDSSPGEKLFVVYDLGGGTFDVTVIRMSAGLLEVLGTGGDPNLGGGDFDDRIVGWMLEHLRKNHPGYAATLTDERLAALKMKLKSYAEEGKIKLCESQDASPSYTFQIASIDIFEGSPINFTETLTRQKFEELICDLLENSLKWIDVAMEVPKGKYNYTEENVTAILLVGGSTRVPLVRQILERRFPKTPIRGRECGINPDEIVALGAAIVASDENPEGVDAVTKTLVDVTGHTLSVAALDARSGREELCPIIPKETPIPCRGLHEFSSMGNFQQLCRVRVFQGEGKAIDPKLVTMIGEFEIKIEAVKESIPLKIGLDLDGNGLLIAHATEGRGGQKVECRINYQDSAQLSPQELEKKRKELDATLNAVLRQAANPLEGQASPGPANAWAPPTAAQAPADPTAAMNPILRSLYQKAVNNFHRVPADRQGALIQLVTDVENAARSGDQGRLSGYLPQLSKLLEGID
jgi:molecular chaperone DnaK